MHVKRGILIIFRLKYKNSTEIIFHITSSKIDLEVDLFMKMHAIKVIQTY